MGYIAGFTICYGVNVSSLIDQSYDNVCLKGQEWDYDTWQYGDELYTVEYLKRTENVTDEEMDAIPKPLVIYTDIDKYSDHATHFILAASSAERSYQGSGSFDLPKEDEKETAQLKAYCEQHQIPFEPKWWVLLPNH